MVDKKKLTTSSLEKAAATRTRARRCSTPPPPPRAPSSLSAAAAGTLARPPAPRPRLGSSLRRPGGLAPPSGGSAPRSDGGGAGRLVQRMSRCRRPYISTERRMPRLPAGCRIRSKVCKEVDGTGSQSLSPEQCAAVLIASPLQQHITNLHYGKVRTILCV